MVKVTRTRHYIINRPLSVCQGVNTDPRQQELKGSNATHGILRCALRCRQGIRYRSTVHRRLLTFISPFPVTGGVANYLLDVPVVRGIGLMGVALLARRIFGAVKHRAA